MDKLEKIEKFVKEESLKVLGNLQSINKQVNTVDYGIDVGALYILEKIKRILEDNNAMDNK